MMKSARHSSRYACKVSASLRHRGMNCLCQLENISMSGTLVRLKDSTCDPIQKDDECTLTIFKDSEKPAVQIATRVVHQGFTLVGLKFIESDSERISSLVRFIEGIAIDS
jgi:c-di-GMP-binding flagellar brake protein YcgR